LLQNTDRKASTFYWNLNPDHLWSGFSAFLSPFLGLFLCSKNAWVKHRLNIFAKFPDFKLQF